MFLKLYCWKWYDDKIGWPLDALRKSIDFKNKLYKKARKFGTAKTE